MVTLSKYNSSKYNLGIYNIEGGLLPNTVSLELDGKGQYLSRTESTTALGAYNLGIYSDGIYNSPNNLGIGNTWTMGFWVRPIANKEHQTIFSTGDNSNKDRIDILSTPLPVETQVHSKRPSELRVIIKDFEGTTIKHYGWPDWFQTEVWTHTFLQWNGFDLNAFRNAFTTTTGVSFVNASGIMGDEEGRRIYYGSAVAGQFATFSGILGHFGMWSEILDPIELGTVVSGGFGIDLTTASAGYDSQANLQHYWKPGEDPTNIGKDYTTSGTALNLTKERNITDENIVSEAP